MMNVILRLSLMQRIMSPFIVLGLFSTSLSYAKDETHVDEFGQSIVVRTNIVQDENGEDLHLQQKFIRLPDQLLYLKGSSSPETIRYAENICGQQGKFLDIDYGVKMLATPAEQQKTKTSQNQSEAQVLISCHADLNLVASLAKQAGMKHAITQQLDGGYVLQSWYTPQGEKIIERRVRLETAQGKSFQTQKRFLALGENQMLYLRNSASAETLSYEEIVCQEYGAGVPAPDRGIRIESIGTSYGYSCSDTLEKQQR
ncbi:hypothetical protein EC844_11394 [Acinetobacter calcoaceticus]|uniref:Uncharacterized protein n=1 Tax=Acinetobacter calcoaceticus TaxID=471 RepID=A0A4R1XQH6_ACICA|nr:hypothetical protein EC844_11394 [Acinetobacter calcoaceticus]